MKPVATYSQAVRVGDLIYTAVTALSPKTGEPANGTVAEETETTLQNLKGILEDAGSSLEKVFKTTVYLTKWESYAEYNRIYARFFPKDPPARATLGIRQLYGGLKIEIEAIAIA